jgi:hypothetical protein
MLVLGPGVPAEAVEILNDSTAELAPQAPVQTSSSVLGPDWQRMSYGTLTDRAQHLGAVRGVRPEARSLHGRDGH